MTVEGCFDLVSLVSNAGSWGLITVARIVGRRSKSKRSSK